MPIETIIGIIAGVLTSSALIPQVVKIIKEKNAENISIGTVLCLFIGHAIWIYYGISKKDLPVILTNVFAILIDMVTLALKRIFKNKKGN